MISPSLADVALSCTFAAIGIFILGQQAFG